MPELLTKKYLNRLTYEIIGAAIEVHREIGPGLLEKIYAQFLMHEFSLRGLSIKHELPIEVKYKGVKVPTELRCDFLVENAIVVEVKSVGEIIPVFEAQLISYMRLLNVPKGILINFNCKNIFDEGQSTHVNEMFANLPQE